MNDGNSKLADRIRKLLALAGNTPSEAEAAAAMERASALMTEHNLSMAEVAMGSQERIEAAHDGESARQTWARTIWDGVAQLNFCYHCYHSPRPHGGLRRMAGGRYEEASPHVGDRHYIIGTPGNVEATKLMACYLVQPVERLERENRELYGLHERHAFKIGCAERLWDRLNALRRQRASEAQPPKPAATTGPNLPTLAGLYDMHDVANREFYKALHDHMPRGCYSARVSNFGAYERGMAAGAGIGLDTQVKGARILALPKQ